MIIKKTRNKKLPLLVLALVALVGVAAFFIISGQKQNSPDSPAGNSADASPTQSLDEKKNVSSETEASKQQNDALGNDTSVASAEPTTVYVQLPNVSVSGNTLTARAIIQTIDKDGVCKLTLKKSGSPSSTWSARTQTMGSYTTCAGFDVDIRDLEKGTWAATVEYQGSENKAGAATKEVTL